MGSPLRGAQARALIDWPFWHRYSPRTERPGPFVTELGVRGSARRPQRSGRERLSEPSDPLFRGYIRVPESPTTSQSGSAASSKPAGADGKSGAGLEGVVAAKSAICFIDGTAGRLVYRGYEIGDLVEHTTFEEVAFLLWDERLPNRGE